MQGIYILCNLRLHLNYEKFNTNYLLIVNLAYETKEKKAKPNIQ